MIHQQENPARSNTTAQLRRDIDRGRAADKVSWPDPAAAPLGTDDEAASAGLSEATIVAARRAKVNRPVAPAVVSERNLPLGYGVLIAAIAIALLLGMVLVS
jgi:hypothetical protein